MKRIVIIGGGYAGYNLAKRLDFHADVVLIEARDAFVHNVGAIRALVKPDLAPSLILPYQNLLNRGRVVHARATAVDSGGVQLHDGERIEADIIILAMGSGYAAPFKPGGDSVAIFSAAMDRAHHELRKAQSVSIVGAGAVGIELAGEIASAFPQKSVTLLSDRDSFFPTYRRGLHQALKKRLEALGVLIRFNAIAGLPAKRTAPFAGPVLLNSGECVKADIVFPVIGAEPKPGFAQDLPDVILGRSGRLQVDGWLRPCRSDKIFVIGDLADCGDGMTVVAALRQAAWLGSTLKHVLSGQSIKELPRYRPWSVAPILLPLGEHRGASLFPTSIGTLVVGDWITAQIKGKKLFVPRYRREFGLG